MAMSLDPRPERPHHFSASKALVDSEAENRPIDLREAAALAVGLGGDALVGGEGSPRGSGSALAATSLLGYQDAPQ